MSPAGIGLVIRQEFRIRLRTGRWRWLIGAWVVLLALFTFVLDAGLDTGYTYAYGEDNSQRGVPLFGFLMFFILGVMLVISPALTSQSINGDRERGTLATLQVTRLRPAEIAVGKLLAGWGVGLVALALSLPFAGYAMAQGGITVGRISATYGVVAVLVGSVCAISQALSALLARSITSALLSYLTTAFLAVGTIVSFGLALPLTEERALYPAGPYGETYLGTQVRQDRVWWLIAANPFVVLADAAPRVPPKVSRNGAIIRVEDYDPLSQISHEVRRLRLAPNEETQYNYDSYGNPTVVRQAPDRPVWPYGFAFLIILGAGSAVVTTIRLRTPARRLARGVRVA